MIWITLSVLFALLLVLLILFLFAIRPNKPRAEMKKYLFPVRYAHRGLHDEEKAENSLSAYRAAVERGFGIEFDVRLSKDGELVVFHDDDLKRLCGVDKNVVDLTKEELQRLHLSGTDDVIPTLQEVLSLVDGKVPLLVEIKDMPRHGEVVEKTVEALKAYRGDFIVESFNPLYIAKVKKLMPEVCRGVLSMNFSHEKSFKAFFPALQLLLLNFRAKPDFIAYEVSGWRSFSLNACRKLFHTASLCWVPRSQQEEQDAYRHGFDAVIFENYIPEE